MWTLDLFAGAGGSALAGKLLGWRSVGYVELDPYCRHVLAARIRDGILDDAPIIADIRTFDGRPWTGIVDCVTAGFPCQPFSVAGRRRGADDERNLWPETARVLREVRPRLALLENVPGLLTHAYFGDILRDLAELGFDAEWGVLSAATLGAPHRRRRLWIVAYANECEQRTQQIGECGSGDSPEPRDAGAPGQAADADRARSQMYECRSRQEECGAISELWADSWRPRWWTAEPGVCGVAHGVAHRSHRLRALGNGWVPSVAARAFRQLELRARRVGGRR